MISKKMKIPFHLCDPAGIMFFGAYLEIYHLFLEEALPQMGIPWKTWFMEKTGAPVRGLQVAYDIPLAFGKDYDAQISVKKMGSSSFTFCFEMFSDKGRHASAEVTHVFVDFQNHLKTEIPSEIRASLKEHLQAPS